MKSETGAERSRFLRAEDRRDAILNVLKREGKVSVDDICRDFNVSAVTARADLNLLEERGKARRIHGGALSVDNTLMVEDIERRMTVNTNAKRRIAQIANRLVNDGDALLVDSGSTTFEFLRTLDNRWDLTIVTHDLMNAAYVQTHLKNAHLILLGGAVHPTHGYCHGTLTLRQLDQIFVDKAFLATNSFSPEAGFMTENEGAAGVKSALLSHARQRTMLVDSSKVGLHNYIRFAEIKDFDYIIMDDDPGQVVAQAIASGDEFTRLLTK